MAILQPTFFISPLTVTNVFFYSLNKILMSERFFLCQAYNWLSFYYSYFFSKKRTFVLHFHLIIWLLFMRESLENVLARDPFLGNLLKNYYAIIVLIPFTLRCGGKAKKRTRKKICERKLFGTQERMK